MNDPKQETFECWAVVELFGHQKIAGKVTEQSIAGSAMLRVDVPDVGGQPAYTRFFGNGAIYSINPTSEEIARGMVPRCWSEPVSHYELPKLAEATQRISPSGCPNGDDDET